MSQIEIIYKRGSFDDGSLCAGRNKYIFVAHRNGDITPFYSDGKEGSYAILSSEYEKNGKWSKTNFEVATSNNCCIVVYHADMHQNLFDKFASLEELYNYFISNMPFSINREKLFEVLKENTPHSFKKLVEKNNILLSLNLQESKRVAIVSRHEATITKLLEKYTSAIVFRESVNASRLHPFDKIVGNLPFSIASELCEFNIEVHIVEWNTFPPRGEELSEEDFEKYGFRTSRYIVFEQKN